MRVKQWIGFNIVFWMCIGIGGFPAFAAETKEPLLLAQTLFKKAPEKEFEARIHTCTGHKLSVKAKECRSKFGKAKAECRRQLQDMRIKCRKKSLNRWKNVEPVKIGEDDDEEEEEEDNSVFAIPPPSPTHR